MGQVISGMKGVFPGTIRTCELPQALYEESEFFEKYRIQFVSNLSFFFYASTQSGDRFSVYNTRGRLVKGFISGGLYQAAADELICPYSAPHPTDYERREITDTPHL